jgi:plastocyanin
LHVSQRVFADRVRGAARAAVLVACAASAGCGGGQDDVANKQTVVIDAQQFEPAHTRIRVGGRVVFLNKSSAFHTAYAAPHGPVDPTPGSAPGEETKHDGSDINYGTRRGFATHGLATTEAQTIIFKAAGKFAYHCQIHKNMTGVIEVVPEGS